ncbi:MAG: MFS transporter [Acidimicrobiales bacterium]
MRMGTREARWVLLATVLGSGMAFLDGTIVNVALPAIAEDLDAGLGDLQWVVNAYLVTLSSLVLLGGSLGDRFGRARVFRFGLCGFTAASVLCGLAPNVGVLIGARAVQGVGAALLVPGSLAIIAASFHPDDRAAAVGAWSGLSGVATAIGPFVGGWLIDSVSWRLAFVINVPLAVVVAVAARHVPETRAEGAGRIDVVGALTASVGLAATTYGLIERSPRVGVAGLAVLVVFVVIEARSASPMVPLGLFASRQFSGANLTTLAVYGALGGASFLLVLELQIVLGYSALEAGSAMIPVTLLMLLLSARAGALAQRIGPRLPMTIGPFLVGAGLVLWSGIDEGSSYLSGVLPGAVVFGLGLSLTVAPLTATIMASVDASHLGVASGVNNAVARLAGLLAVAVLPLAVGLDTATASSSGLDAGADDALLIAAAMAAIGGVVAFVTVRTIDPAETPRLPGLGGDPCGDPCLIDHAHAPAAAGRR